RRRPSNGKRGWGSARIVRNRSLSRIPSPTAFRYRCRSSYADDIPLDLWAALNKNDLLDIIALSLGVSLSATVLAALLGLPLGGILAVHHFRGRRLVTILLNGLLGLPPVVVGLALYLLLSRSGPLGWLGLL